MELELFTVSIKDGRTIHVQFNNELLEVASEEELLDVMKSKMEGLIPIVSLITDYIHSKF